MSLSCLTRLGLAMLQAQLGHATVEKLCPAWTAARWKKLMFGHPRDYECALQMHRAGQKTTQRGPYVQKHTIRQGLIGKVMKPRPPTNPKKIKK
eukprot:1738473-Amphidinium_carterae.1